MNHHALFSPREQYQRIGTVENFRIAAGLSARSRQGFVYTDSDLQSGPTVEEPPA